MEQLSKEAGVQPEASKATLGGCLGLDGDMLVLRQAASRRCGRTIVDADAGCKMLSPGEWGRTAARGRRVCCAAFYSSKVTDDGKGDGNLLR